MRAGGRGELDRGNFFASKLGLAAHAWPRPKRTGADTARVGEPTGSTSSPAWTHALLQLYGGEGARRLPRLCVLYVLYQVRARCSAPLYACIQGMILGLFRMYVGNNQL